MRTFKATDVKEFYNTRKSQNKCFIYPKWQGEIYTDIFRTKHCLLTDNMINNKYTNKKPDKFQDFYLKLSDSNMVIRLGITDFDFVTIDCSPEEEYPYLLDDFSKQWQEFLVEKYPDYSKKLREHGEKKLQACKNKYNNKKKELIRELEYDFKEEAKPYLDMIAIASGKVDADDKELD